MSLFGRDPGLSRHIADIVGRKYSDALLLHFGLLILGGPLTVGAAAAVDRRDYAVLKRVSSGSVRK